MGQPISLSDSALTTIVQLCRPLTPEARIAFMAALADELRDEPQPLGDGTVARTARALCGFLRLRTGIPIDRGTCIATNLHFAI